MDFSQWFIRIRPTLYIGVWLTWFLSPFVVLGNLQVWERFAWMPSEVIRALTIVFAMAWLIGIVAFSILLVAALRIAPGESSDASKAQAEYESRRTSSSRP